MNKIKKIIALASLLVAIGSLVPVVLSQVDITASVNVQKTCGITVEPTSLDFGTPAPGTTSSPDSVDVTNTGGSGQTECRYTIEGNDWSGQGPLGVGATKYMCTDSSSVDCDTDAFTALTTDTVGSGVDFLGLDASTTAPVDFHVVIPSNQLAGIYSQIITITLVDPA